MGTAEPNRLTSLEDILEYIDECVAFVCYNTSYTEEFVLWHDWHWLDDRIERILRYRGEERRFSMHALLSSVGYAFGGKEAREPWEGLLQATYTESEAGRNYDAEEAELEELLAIQRAERTAAYLANPDYMETM